MTTLEAVWSAPRLRAVWKESMTKAKQDIEIELEETLTMTGRLRDEDGNPVDITGASAWFTVREDATEAKLIEKTVGSGITLTAEASGDFSIAIAAADIEDMLGTYIFDLFFQLGAEVRKTLRGRFVVRQSLHS